MRSLRSPEIIFCLKCGQICGKEYPPRFSGYDGGEPGFREGIGENFEDDNGEWFCSKDCLEKYKSE